MGFSRVPDLKAEQIQMCERERANADARYIVKGWRRIAEELGLNRTAVLRHFAPEQLCSKYGMTVGEITSIQPLAIPDASPPKAVIEEWERVMTTAGQRDLTALLLGDPPPGRSALDRKRERETA